MDGIVSNFLSSRISPKLELLGQFQNKFRIVRKLFLNISSVYEPASSSKLKVYITFVLNLCQPTRHCSSQPQYGIIMCTVVCILHSNNSLNPQNKNVLIFHYSIYMYSNIFGCNKCVLENNCHAKCYQIHEVYLTHYQKPFLYITGYVSPLSVLH